MIAKKILSFLLLLSIVCSFSSCEDDPFDENYDPGYWLCNTEWMDTFESSYNEECDQMLLFRPDGTGVEHREYYYIGELYPHQTNKYRFVWSWDDQIPNAIFMDYEDGTSSYFYNVYANENILTGVLDDENVTFRAR